jgi:hypothetical protein
MSGSGYAQGNIFGSEGGVYQTYSFQVYTHPLSITILSGSFMAFMSIIGLFG